MTIQKINSSISFLQSSQLNYVVLKVLLFLYMSQFTTAQQPGAGTTSSRSEPPFSDPYSLGQKFSPTMAVVMAILVSVFFFIGFFSVYVRRFHGVHFDPAAVRGGGSRSWRGYHGLEPEVIATFPTFLYSAVKGLKIGKAILECAVCLNEFEDDQTLRLIPKCSHVFHPDCIDAWLTMHVTCPVCRANLVPKPGDLPLARVHVPEPDQNLVEPDNQINFNEEAQTNQVQIHITDNNDQIIGEVPQQTTQSPNMNLLRSPNMNFLSPTNGPLGSWSTGWRLHALFSRSNSTGHSLVQPGENYERFTLRLPENVRSQLMNTQLNRTKSCVTFSRVRSPRKGYRSRSGGTGRRGRTFLFYERFDQEGRPEQWGFTTTPPFLYKASPSRSSKEMTGGDHEANATPPKNFLRSVRSMRSPLHRLFLGFENSNRDNSNNNNNNNDNIGERSFDRLRPADCRV